LALVIAMLLPTAAQAAQGLFPDDPITDSAVESSPEPSVEPSAGVTPEPTAEPAPEPSSAPSGEPSAAPSPEPTAEPSAEPSVEPSKEPTAEPSAAPTEEPSPAPSAVPADGAFLEEIFLQAALQAAGQPRIPILLTKVDASVGNGANHEGKGLFFGPDETYKNYFQIESDYLAKHNYTKALTEEAEAVTLTTANTLDEAKKSSATAYFFPADVEEKLGRLPDWEFQGLYYNAAPEGTQPIDWSQMVPVRKFTQEDYDRLCEQNIYNTKNSTVTPFQDVYQADDLVGRCWTGELYREGGLTSEYPLSSDAAAIGDALQFSSPKVPTATLSVIGRWEPSANATLRALTLEDNGEGVSLYSDTLLNQATAGLTETEVNLEEGGTYYLRVPAATETLDLSLDAFEPYFAYNVLGEGDAPVRASLRPAGDDTAAPVDLTGVILNVPTQKTYEDGSTDYTATNSTEAPAASRWTAAIPLAHTKGWTDAKTGEGASYNELTVSVTSPDGQSETTFTFFIQRLTDPTLTRAYGNTPAGMIEREPAVAENHQTGDHGFTDSERQQLREYWRANHTLVGNGIAKFESSLNNAGHIYEGTYHTFDKPELFSFDKDSTAIVIYQNSAAQDPGFTLTDSQGNPVDFADVTDPASLYYQSVTRRLKLDVVDQLGPTALTYDKLEADKIHQVYYTGGQTVTPIADADNDGKVAIDADTQQLDFRGLNILPGVYTLEYFFADPYADATYSADAAAFEDGQNAPSFDRTLVVLPKPGDLNMDGLVNIADYRAMNQYWTGSIGSNGIFNKVPVGESDRLTLVSARVMDVDHNGGLTTEDVTNLCGKFSTLANRENIHYIPLPNDLPEVKRTEYHQSVHDGDSNDLSLRYMGVGNQPLLQYNPDNKVQLGNLFWVGLELKNPKAGSLWTKGLDSMTFTITYDSTYLMPAVDVDKQNFADANLDLTKLANDTATMQTWRAMMNQQNANSQVTVWQDNYTFSINASRPATTPVYNRASRPITDMESRTSASRRREMTVTLELRNGITPHSFQAGQGGILLVVPFYLTSYPYQSDPYLMELALGDRELVVTTTDHDTAAYVADSGERPLFGGSHHINIHASSNFSQGITVHIPLGEDTTKALDLKDYNTGKDAVYGEPFEARTNLSFGEMPVIGGQLPPGVEYDYRTGRFTGVPEKAGTYVFSVSSTRLRLVVDKAPLRVFAEAKRRYYGETNLVDAASIKLGDGTYTFRYLTADIKPLDLERVNDLTGEEAIANNGFGVSLPKLLGEGAQVGQPRDRQVGESDEDYAVYLEDYAREYTISYKAPLFQAYANENPNHTAADYVTKTTTVGTYSIAYAQDGSPSTTNYYFEMATPEQVKTAGYTHTPNSLVISRRPVYIQRFDPNYLANPDKTFYNDEGLNLVGLTATRTGAADDPFTLAVYTDNGLLTEPAVVEPDDVLTINLQLEVWRIDKDVENQGSEDYFNLGENPSETRTAFVKNFGETTLVNPDEGDAKNYMISDTTVAKDETQMRVTVKVTRRAISSLTIQAVPTLDFTYGESITSANALKISTVAGYGAGQKPAQTSVYDPKTFEARGLHACWLAPEDKAAMEALDAPGLLAYLKDKGAVDDHNKVIDADKVGLPYKVGDPITSAHSGRYLCVWTTTTDEKNDPIAIMAVWAAPLSFTPKTLTLTLPHLSRYYGEENPEVGSVFTYRVDDLAPCDRTGVAGLTGDGSELMEKVFLTDTPDEELDAIQRARKQRVGAYTQPTVTIQTAAGEPVTRWTPADSLNRARITISGAALESGNYVFRYTQSNNPSVEPVPNDTEGFSTLTIQPRPVVVEQVFSDDDHPLATLYADTRSMDLVTGQKSPDGSRELLSAMPIAWTGDNGGIPYTDGETYHLGFTLTFPAVEENGVTHKGWYYQATGGAAVLQSPREEDLGYDPDAARALVLKEDGTLPDLKLNYTLTAISDNQYWNDLVSNRFLMEDATTKRYPCQLSNLSLAGEDAGNYQLVYNRQDDAVYGLPSGRVYTDQERYQDGERLLKNMYTAGKINVTLRPISSFEVISAPRVSYTYGDLFAPDRAAHTNGRPLTVRLVYTTDLDNAPALNRVHCNESLTFAEGGVGQPDTFAQRGLYLFYRAKGEGDVTVTADDLANYDSNPHAIRLHDRLYVDRHDGAALIVAGQRPGVDGIVQRTTDITLTVRKKELPLTVADSYRYYGEPNPAFTYTIETSDLAQWDQPLAAADAQATLRAIETAHGGTLTAPAFTTTATPTSDVVDQGYGGYPIAMTAGAAMTNYTFAPTDATLHVLRRPIQVGSFAQDNTRPIYTIFNDTGNNVFYTNVSNYNHTVDEDTNKPLDCLVTMALPPLASGYYANVSDPAYPSDHRQLTMSGAALVKRGGREDEINLHVTVTFPPQEEREKWSGTQTDRYGSVTVKSWSLTDLTPDCKNYYVLPADSQGKQAPGMVKLRDISGIEIFKCPNLTYTYGDTLSLTGLQVKITMMKKTGGADEADNVYVDYAGPDQFATYGLYVNYYDKPEPPSTQEEWNSLFTSYRTAATGDHLTIAPAHDNSTLLPRDANGNFAHNGKYLIVSARLPGYPDFVCPQMVRLSPDSSKENKGTPLTVNPLQLTYTLTAADKTYDGSVDAAGSITLTNAYHGATQLYQKLNADNTGAGVSFQVQTAAVTDAIYVAVGADYEKGTAAGWKGFTALADYINSNGKYYTFTTGSYDAADLDTSGLTYTGGNNYNRNNHLNFQFVADDADNGPNVAYAAAQDNSLDTHVWGTVTDKAVQVTNIRLAGPDAANYTLTAAHQVTKATVEGEKTGGGYQDANLPRATVHKANRPKLTVRPAVELDPHTNAMRVTYDAQTVLAGLLSAYSHDAMDDTLHLEYALQQVKEDNTPVQTQALASLLDAWGVDPSRCYYSDNPHFGGELVRPALTGLENYIPEEEDYPREAPEEGAVYYGQLYPWAAEDGEIRLAVEAYPGGIGTDENGSPVTYDYPTYLLYDWTEAGERTPLDRDAVYWGLVRVAETWNYLPSPPTSSVDGEVDAAAYAVQQALEAGEADLTGVGAALKTAAQTAMDAATAAAQEEVAELRRRAQEDEWPEEGHYPADRIWPRANAGDETSFQRQAIKTYHQRLDLISVAQRPGAATPAPEEDYRVPKLEAVWFTDLDSLGQQGEDLEGEDELDAFTRNYQPNRYYGYFWDALMEAALSCDWEESEPQVQGWTGDLTGPITLTYTGESADGEAVTYTVTVNENRTLTLYVDDTANGGGGILENTITVTPASLVTYLGADPIQLTVTFRPDNTTMKWVGWTTTDPNVATVDENGLVTVVGVGECDIIARSYAGRTFTVHVTVDYRNPLEALFPNSVIDLGYAPALFGLDKGYYFYPSRYMTREELIRLLARLYRKNESRKPGQAIKFADLPAGDPSLADDVDLLTSLGVLTGVEGGLLAPDQVATRAEMVTLLARMLSPDVAGDPAAPHAFADTNPEDTWAWAYIDFLTQQGILQGVGDGYFDPGRGLTRAEAAAFLVRLLDSQNMTWLRESYRVPVDVPTEHWGYQEILKALNGRKDYFDQS